MPPTEAVLVCGPQKDNPLHRQVTGSTDGVCSTCDEPVWVAPSGRTIIQEQGARVICTPCFEASVGPGDLIAPTTRQQRIEMEQWAAERRAPI